MAKEAQADHSTAQVKNWEPAKFLLKAARGEQQPHVSGIRPSPLGLCPLHGEHDSLLQRHFVLMFCTSSNSEGENAR